MRILRVLHMLPCCRLGQQPAMAQLRTEPRQLLKYGLRWADLHLLIE